MLLFGLFGLFQSLLLAQAHTRAAAVLVDELTADVRSTWNDWSSLPLFSL